MSCMKHLAIALLSLSVVGCANVSSQGIRNNTPISISGRYPSLAMFNHEGECGTGAVVLWAGKLWVITYAPHKPLGSDDKLYSIDTDLKQTINPLSIGGTPAARLIHKESNQLVLGSYVIDDKGNVRVVPFRDMPGRITAIARHLTDPANLVYVYGMEGELYELNVHTLAVNKIFDRAVPGWHGKGMNSSQGILVVANNGEAPANNNNKTYQAGTDKKDPEDAGVLAQYDGKDWKIIERKQFTDVTTAGGIYGAPDANAPLWSIGWDKRSVMLKLLDGKQWYTYRLPKADYSYDGYHGWHTEWPRIREINDGKYLMNMHGGWFDFPPTFSAANTSGIRPIASHAKITGDFCFWNNHIVFGCDDLAKSDFVGNPKTETKFTSQSQSNLWFSSWKEINTLSTPYGNGSVWLGDAVSANKPSDAFLIAGYTHRNLHLWHGDTADIKVKIEIDTTGKGNWTTVNTLTVPAGKLISHIFPDNTAGEWVRLTTDKDVTKINACFAFGSSGGKITDKNLFSAFPDAKDTHIPQNNGHLFALGDDTGNLLFQRPISGSTVLPKASFTINANLKFIPTDTPDKNYAVGSEVQMSSDAASIIVTEGKKIFRLPRSTSGLDPEQGGRTVREVVTERYLLNTGGSFYILPRSISGGTSHIKPISTHNKRIDDFAPWRGLMVMSGTCKDIKSDEHIFAADDGTSLWFGDIDDLWKMGKPTGIGGPWLDTSVKAGDASDPYLFAGYDSKILTLSHDASMAVDFTIEVDITGNGDWMTHTVITAASGKPTTYAFPPGFNAHWVRIKASQDCKATAQLKYE